MALVISPNLHQCNALLEEEPVTEHEKLLAAALWEAQQMNAAQKVIITKMQAETILQCTYVEDIRGQLQGQEAKKSKASQTGCLPKGDGRARVLTQDEFFEGVQALHEAHDAAKEALSKRKDAKEVQGGSRSMEGEEQG
jgi:hydroxymethylpyrimidine/phosphomethylpyrimidine kinase